MDGCVEERGHECQCSCGWGIGERISRRSVRGVEEEPGAFEGGSGGYGG